MPPVSADPVVPHALSRRAALQALAAGAASLAAGCSRPDEAIVARDTLEELPYVHLPEGLVPGVLQRYATALPLAGYARGALVTSFEGRPVKVEGDPRHPASLGATDVFAQAEILSLYDPDRSQAIRAAGEISDWPAFEAALAARLERHRADGGATLSLLSGRITSPTLLEQLELLQGLFPNMRRHVFEPSASGDGAAAQAVYGRPMALRPRLADADVAVAFAADPLGPGPDQVRNGRALVERRRRDRGSFRLYAVESAMSLTGAFADHRLAATPDATEAMIAALASTFGAPIARPQLPRSMRISSTRSRKTCKRAREEDSCWSGLRRRTPRRSASGSTTGSARPVDAFDPDPQMSAAGTLADLAEAVRAGRVETLVVVDSNPVASAPGELGFETLVGQVPFRIHVGGYFDETAAASTWHLPAPHPLESWSDVAATDGVVSIVQPLIRPLHDSYSAHRLLAALCSEPERSDYDRVRATWRARWGGQDFEARWRRALLDGVVAGAAAKPVAKPSARFPGWKPAPPGRAWRRSSASMRRSSTAASPTTRGCRNAPGRSRRRSGATRSRWRSPTRNGSGVEEGDEVEIGADGRSVYGPVRLSNGLAPGVLQLSLGYGRTRAGAIGDGVGFNAAELRVRKLALGPARRELAQGRRATAASLLRPRGCSRSPERPGSWRRRSTSARPPSTPRPLPTFFPPWPTPAGDPYAWGMVVDTDACIGCNACVVACQSENNVPVDRPGRDRMGPRHAVAPGRRLRPWERARRRDPCSSRCPACIASLRPASPSARSRPRCTTTRA